MSGSSHYSSSILGLPVRDTIISSLILIAQLISGGYLFSSAITGSFDDIRDMYFNDQLCDGANCQCANDYWHHLERYHFIWVCVCMVHETIC